MEWVWSHATTFGHLECIPYFLSKYSSLFWRGHSHSLWLGYTCSRQADKLLLLLSGHRTVVSVRWRTLPPGTHSLVPIPHPVIPYVPHLLHGSAFTVATHLPKWRKKRGWALTQNEEVPGEIEGQLLNTNWNGFSVQCPHQAPLFFPISTHTLSHTLSS